jgi:ABC-type glycerol-3-phosphate transport system substrate-binding protein
MIRALLIAIALAAAGCSSAPSPGASKDIEPQIWRPVDPVYPKP